jgi:hypothetical protein
MQGMVFLLPVKQITTYSMAPPHRTPSISFNIMLKKEMPNSIKIHEAIGVIDPLSF